MRSQAELVLTPSRDGIAGSRSSWGPSLAPPWSAIQMAPLRLTRASGDFKETARASNWILGTLVSINLQPVVFLFYRQRTITVRCARPVQSGSCHHALIPFVKHQVALATRAIARSRKSIIPCAAASRTLLRRGFSADVLLILHEVCNVF